MRFKPRVQGERLFDSIMSRVPLYFTQDEITGEEIAYDHNGCPVLDVGVNSIPLTEEELAEINPFDKQELPKFGMNFARYSKRTSKLGLNTFNTRPVRMIESLGGKRDQFKAAVALSSSHQVSYKLNQHELQNEFNEVARNIKHSQARCYSGIRAGESAFFGGDEEFQSVLSPQAATAVAKSAMNFYRLKNVGRSQGNRLRATSMTPQGDKKGLSMNRGELNRKQDRRQIGMSPHSHADEEKILLG